MVQTRILRKASLSSTSLSILSIGKDTLFHVCNLSNRATTQMLPFFIPIIIEWIPSHMCYTIFLKVNSSSCLIYCPAYPHCSWKINDIEKYVIFTNIMQATQYSLWLMRHDMIVSRKNSCKANLWVFQWDILIDCKGHVFHLACSIAVHSIHGHCLQEKC